MFQDLGLAILESLARIDRYERANKRFRLLNTGHENCDPMAFATDLVNGAQPKALMELDDAIQWELFSE